MKTYIFTIAMEEDAGGWRAFFPALEEQGASTWGKTRAEALKNIREALSMIVEEFAREGRTVPITKGISVLEGTWVAVNV